MNGIMVTLLILCTTGIVSAQQNSTSNPYGQAKFAGPLPSDFQGPGMPSGPAQQTAPFEIEISTLDIDGLTQGAVLKSAITPQDPVTGKILPAGVVSGISLIHTQNLGRFIPSADLVGVDLGGGILQFDLNEKNLADLKTKKLVFQFSNRDRGRIKQVVFRFVPSGPIGGPPSAIPPSPIRPSPDFPPSSAPLAGQQNNVQNLDLPVPPPIYLPGDRDYMGPVIRQQNNNRKFADAWQPPQNQRFSDTLPTTPPVTPITTNDLALSREREKIRKKKIEQDLREQELNQLKNELVSANDNLEKQYRDFKLQQFRATQQVAPPPSGGAPAAGSQLANQSNGAPAAGSQLANQSGNQPPDRFASQNSITGLESGPQSNPITRIPGQGTVNAGVRGMAASIPASPPPGESASNPEDTGTSKDNRTVKTMFFMLLCSLGLNAYLGLISRGFYVRYNELADELRETFTSSL